MTHKNGLEKPHVIKVVDNPTPEICVYGGNDPGRKVLKHCPPPEGGLSLDALKYGDAKNANEKFAQAHLAALDMYVPDGRGGIFLIMEWRGGGSQNYLPLTSFLDREALGGACRAVVKSVLIDWQEGRRPQQTLGSVTSHEVLQVIAGEKCMLNRSLYNIARDLGIAEASRLSVGGTEFCNPFLAVSQNEGLADFRTAGIRGNGHGDLHPGNILVPSAARPGGASEQFDEYYLIDLSSFDNNRFLAIDPAHLMLSLANERLSELFPGQRDSLRELILDPAEADAGNLPSGIAGAVRAISQVGRDLYDGPRRLFEDWYQETLLAVAGCALLFVGRNRDVEIRFWFLQLGGMAIDKVNAFVAGRTGGQATSNLPRGTAVAKPLVAPDPPTTQEQPADDSAPSEAEDDNLIFISAAAKRFNDLRSGCSRLSAEFTDSVGDLEPYLARSRGIPGTRAVRDVLGDLAQSVATLRSWQKEGPYGQRLSVDSAIALIETRLDEAGDLAHEISVNGSTPTLKNSLGQAAEELDGAFQDFFALIVSDQPASP